MEERTFRIRVEYGKSGRLAMLSHLEITHALERMVRRAGLPFALSQGFSPHMKIAFGSALPVGIGSTCEIFDLSLRDYMAPAKVLAALQDAAPANLMPISAQYVEPKAKAASVAYPFSVYEAVLNGDAGSFDVPEQIEVVRKKKAKSLNVADFLIGDISVDGNVLRFQLQQTDNGNLRPDVLMHAIFEPCRISSITRIAQSGSPISL